MDTSGFQREDDYVGSLFPRPSRTFVTAVAAILFHLLLLIFGKFPEGAPSPKYNAPVEITNLPTRRGGQIVQSRKLKEDPNVDTKFLGERSQRAEKEQRAHTGEKFQSAAKEAAPPASAVPWRSLSLGDLGIRNYRERNQTASERSVGSAAFSSTDDYLKDTPEGPDTALSTREFKYYAYYQRIRDEVKEYWIPEARERIQALSLHTDLSKAGALVTTLLVVLDENGKVEKVDLLRSSGFHEIDAAADIAFHKAAGFPNPPKGLLEADHRVRLKWDFVIELNGPRIGVGLFRP